jgi:hypothetical protein
VVAGPAPPVREHSRSGLAVGGDATQDHSSSLPAGGGPIFSHHWLTTAQ